MNNILSPTGFGLALLCFLFTFCEVKCSGDTVMKISGINMAFGTEPTPAGILANEELDMDGDSDIAGESSGDMNIYALIAFLAALSGLVFFFLFQGKMYALIGTTAGLLAFLCLLILQFNLGNDMDAETKEMVVLQFKIPYWIALLSTLAVGVLNGSKLRK
ncbi:MAG: hypothetical protein KDC34_12935 [Saprospiraceae bacterium]|nr:hypothetical protein [Saprospiraceae bacterium]